MATLICFLKKTNIIYGTNETIIATYPLISRSFEYKMAEINNKNIDHALYELNSKIFFENSNDIKITITIINEK
jgi:hypothetical protein